MTSCTVLFPHQLFEKNPALSEGQAVFLVEEYLFFSQYNFHKQKLAFHRATMRFYADFLRQKGYAVNYIEAQEKASDVRILIPQLAEEGVTTIHVIDPTDNWLSKRINTATKNTNIEVVEYASPLFINSKKDNKSYFEGKKSFFQANFYKKQRKTLDILVDADGNPEGGKWSFDEENRRKYPRKKMPPTVAFPQKNTYQKEAERYVEQHFSENYGSISDTFFYPTTFEESAAWLDDFFTRRFHDFGAYEDALVRTEHILHHSLLTPMLNVGLLRPKPIVDKALEYARTHAIPINSLEGFVRQIIGWREFIRGVYEVKGSEERTRNFWGFTRKIPPSFWDGTTGILPIDSVIRKVLKTGYCHHIERLMVLGNFMLLCEFDPDEVYRWFMELFIDSYDWVMVTNVYGMSQFADGGLMATKPYISGSNYLRKMGDYPKGDWQVTWDGLFWRFMDKQRAFFLGNPRIGMLVRMFDKMDSEKQQAHLENGQRFLDSL